MTFLFLQMCASPLSKDPLTWPKAKAYLEKALSIDNSYLPAVFMLTDIYEHVSVFEYNYCIFTNKFDSVIYVIGNIL